MKEKTLVILAAGMGSRFGGLKQIEPVGLHNEFIIDYSIYSAVKYGFSKVVFIIKEENYDIFKETIGKRIEDKIQVEYAFQKNSDFVEEVNNIESRVKPLGTAHALYCARNYINGNFGIITSDDFYGDSAFKQLSDALENDNTTIIGYPVASTMSENGAVKRGIIMSENGVVSDVIESSCEFSSNQIKCTPLDSKKPAFMVEEDRLCSMLMIGFTKKIISDIEKFMKDNKEELEKNIDSYEFLLPDVIAAEIKNGDIVKTVKTTSRWMGVTYKDDLDKLKEYILECINEGIYPENLWK